MPYRPSCCILVGFGPCMYVRLIHPSRRHSLIQIHGASARTRKGPSQCCWVGVLPCAERKEKDPLPLRVLFIMPYCDGSRIPQTMLQEEKTRKEHVIYPRSPVGFSEEFQSSRRSWAKYMNKGNEANNSSASSLGAGASQEYDVSTYPTQGTQTSSRMPSLSKRARPPSVQRLSLALRM